MEWFNFISGIVGILGTVFGVWQFKESTRVKKIVGDQTRRLYVEAKRLTSYAKKKKEYQRVEEVARSIKYGVIQLDVATRNLSKEKISKLVEQNQLRTDEGEEYKDFIQN